VATDPASGGLGKRGEPRFEPAMAAATSRLAGHQTAKATGLMKALLFTINNALLFLCVSMYLGTGWSMVLFYFPIAPQLTVDIGNIRTYKKGFFNQYVHMIELSANGALFEEFNQINDINARICSGQTVSGRTRPIRLHLIKPDYPLPLDPDFYLGRIDAATLIAMGYADAKKYLSTMKPEGLPLQPEITQMNEFTLGVTFRETMAGGLALDETNPRAS